MDGQFLADLQSFLSSYNVQLVGELRVCKDGWKPGTQSLKFDEIKYRPTGSHLIRDLTGPFITFDADRDYQLHDGFASSGTKMEIIDREKLIQGGMKSPVTGEVYSTRESWNNHLKDRELIEVGNDYNNKKFEVPEIEYSTKEMDAVKRATAEAVSEVFDRKGIRG